MHLDDATYASRRVVRWRREAAGHRAGRVELPALEVSSAELAGWLNDLALQARRNRSSEH